MSSLTCLWCLRAEWKQLAEGTGEGMGEGTGDPGLLWRAVACDQGNEEGHEGR